MLEALGQVPYQQCQGQYAKVRRLVEAATSDQARQSRLYAILFNHGGRCDCTVDRNIVRVPETLAAVEAEIRDGLETSQ